MRGKRFMNTCNLPPNQLLLQRSAWELPDLLEMIRLRLRREALTALTQAASDRAKTLLSILGLELQHSAGVRVTEKSQKRTKAFP